MFYNDGVEIDRKGRVLICPNCKNEEFSDKADFCRVCGTSLYNKCAGEWDDSAEYYEEHNNPGNARFCETCGKPTLFYELGFLKSWETIQAEYDLEQYEIAMNLAVSEDYDDIPF